MSGDPSGYTASGASLLGRGIADLEGAAHDAPPDVLYGGSAGHILGVGIVLGMRALGAI
jgi:hypothetical protein